MTATVIVPQFISDSNNAANQPINLSAVVGVKAGPFADGSSGIEFALLGGHKMRWVCAAGVQAAFLAAIVTALGATAVAE